MNTNEPPVLDSERGQPETQRHEFAPDTTGHYKNQCMLNVGLGMDYYTCGQPRESQVHGHQTAITIDALTADSRFRQMKDEDRWRAIENLLINR